MPVLRYGLTELANQPFAAAQHIEISLPALAFTALLTVLTGIAFGLLPAVRLEPDLNHSLRDGQCMSTTARKSMRNLLAGGEIALAVVVLFIAALLLRSFQNLLAVYPGFSTDHLLAVKIDLPDNLYASQQQVANFSTRLQQQVEEIPGVTSAAITNAMPLTPSKSMTRFAVEGGAPPTPGDFPVTQVRIVSPSYFRTLGIPLLAGRMFQQKDVGEKVPPFVVNATFARRYLEDRDPVGRRLLMDVATPHPVPVPVTGVVNDAKDTGVDAGNLPVIYMAGYPHGQILLVRTGVDPLALAPAIRRTVSSIDHDLGVSEIKTLDGVLSDSLARPRLSATLMGFFAFLSAGLAAIGVFDVLSFGATQRTREIGVRMALGASRLAVVRLVVSDVLLLAAISMVIILPFAILLARTLRSQLFGISPADPLVAAGALLSIALVVALAALLPARRAASVDPMQALRTE